MALTNYKTIFTRSPYYIELSGAVNDITQVKIKIWGLSDSAPAEDTYIFSKRVYAGTTSNRYNISGVIAEYIENNKPDVLTDFEAVYFRVEQCTNLTCTVWNGVAFDGYGEHTDGYNPLLQQEVLSLDGQIIEYEAGQSAGHLTYVWHDNGNVQNFIYTGLVSGTTQTVALTDDVGLIDCVHSSFLDEGNSLAFDDGTVSKPLIITYKPRIECRHTPIKIDFINKFGAWQRLFFYAMSKDKMTVTDKTHKTHLDVLAYDTTRGNIKRYNVNAMDSVTVNSGFIHEGQNPQFEQLLLSKRIRLNDQDCIIKTKSIDYKNSLNDKLINYTIDFEYAYNKINTLG